MAPKKRGLSHLKFKERKNWNNADAESTPSDGRDPSTKRPEQNNKQIEKLFKRALSAGQEKAIEIFMEKKDVLYCKTNNGDTPLLFAINQNWVKLMAKLLQAGADPTICNNKGTDAMKAVFAKKDMSAISLLLSHWGRYRNDKKDPVDSREYNTLMLAVEEKWKVGVQYFLNRVDINHASASGLTALILASKINSLEFVKLLHNCGANVLHECKANMTAVCYAIVKKHQEVGKYLYQQLDKKSKFNYVRNRISLLVDYKMDNYQTFLKNNLFRILLDIKSYMEGGKGILMAINLFETLFQSANHFLTQTQFLQTILQFQACLLYNKMDSSICIDCEFTEMFVDFSGLDFLMQFFEKNDKDRVLKRAALLSVHALGEIKRGRNWIRKNTEILLPCLMDFNENYHQDSFWMEKQDANLKLLWERFKTMFHTLTNINIETEDRKKSLTNVTSDQKSVGEKEEDSISPKRISHPKQHWVKPGANIDVSNRFEPSWKDSVVEEVHSIPSEKKEDLCTYDPYTGHNIGPSSTISENEDGFQLVCHRKKPHQQWKRQMVNGNLAKKGKTLPRNSNTIKDNAGQWQTNKSWGKDKPPRFNRDLPKNQASYSRSESQPDDSSWAKADTSRSFTNNQKDDSWCNAESNRGWAENRNDDGWGEEKSDVAGSENPTNEAGSDRKTTKSCIQDQTSNSLFDNHLNKDLADGRPKRAWSSENQTNETWVGVQATNYYSQFPRANPNEAWSDDRMRSDWVEIKSSDSRSDARRKGEWVEVKNSISLSDTRNKDDWVEINSNESFSPVLRKESWLEVNSNETCLIPGMKYDWSETKPSRSWTDTRTKEDWVNVKPSGGWY